VAIGHRPEVLNEITQTGLSAVNRHAQSHVHWQ
jgi:hypothetical protein